MLAMAIWVIYNVMVLGRVVVLVMQLVMIMAMLVNILLQMLGRSPPGFLEERVDNNDGQHNGQKTRAP